MFCTFHSFFQHPSPHFSFLPSAFSPSFHFLIHLYTLFSNRIEHEASQRRNFNCTRAKRDFYCRFIYFFSFLLRFCFMRFFLFYGLPPSEIGFSLMFLYTLSRPSLIAESASYAHRASKDFVWGQHNTKHFLSSSFPSTPPYPESLILRTIFHIFLLLFASPS